MPQKTPTKRRTPMEGVQENIQQEEHSTIVRIDNVRFGDEDMADRVKLVTTEVVGEEAGTAIAFWLNLKNQDSILTPAMKTYEVLTAAHGDGWTKKFDNLQTAVQALRGKYIAGTSVPKDTTKRGVG